MDSEGDGLAHTDRPAHKMCHGPAVSCVNNGEDGSPRSSLARSAYELAVLQALRFHELQFPRAGDDDIVLRHEVQLRVEALVGD